MSEFQQHCPLWEEFLTVWPASRLASMTLDEYSQAGLPRGQGDVVLICLRTDAFDRALPVFEFPKSESLRLSVLPFCLRERVLVLPSCGSLDAPFVRDAILTMR